MAQIQDGGGSAKRVQPTATTTSASDATKPGPAADILSLRTSAKGRGATAFGRPAPEPGSKPTIREATRQNTTLESRPKPDAGRPDVPHRKDRGDDLPPKERGTAPRATTDDAAAVASESEQRRGRKTENDGRADGGVRSGTNLGGRDARIAELKAQHERLSRESKDVSKEIRELEVEVKGDEKKSKVINVVANAAMPGVGLISGLFGAKNPVASVADRVMDVGGDKRELTDKRGELETAKQQIASDIRTLEGERVLNFLADVAHVTNMPAPVVQVLEGSDSVEVSARRNDKLKSDAAYNKDSDTIIVAGDVLDSTAKTIADLRRAGIVDEDGRIRDAKAFDASTAGDKAIGTAALVGVHEATHGAQDRDGDKITKVNAQVTAMVDGAKMQARNLPPEHREKIVADAERRAEMHRIDALEYDGYVNQETIELQAGKQKKLFTTINPDGSLLPRADAVRNIYELQLGGKMIAGTSAGKSVADVTGEKPKHDHADDHGHDHGHGHDKDAGKHARSQAPATPATTGTWLHDLLTGGTATPGRYTPGGTLPGRYTPGGEIPGRYTPGSDTPGRYTPGRYTPGEDTPGRYTPGSDTPGRYTPGRYTPGEDTPGRYTPGSDTPGRYTPGRYTPGEDTPGRYTPGSDTPGRYTPGRYTPGSKTH